MSLTISKIKNQLQTSSTCKIALLSPIATAFHCCGVLQLTLKIFLFSPLLLWGTSYTWNVDTDGNWSTNANWNPASGHPSSSADTATFGSATSATRTVTVDTSGLAADSLTFNGTQGYIINATGGNSLTISGGAGATEISVSGSITNTISSPLILAGSTVIDQGSSSPLTISGDISGGFGITKQGTGRLVLTGTNSYGVGTTLSAGTLDINADAALGQSGTPINVTGSSTLRPTTTIADIPRDIAISASQTFTVDNNSSDMTISGIISGSTGVLEKRSDAVLYLKGVNTYGGGTSLVGVTSGGNRPAIKIDAASGLGTGNLSVSGTGLPTLRMGASINDLSCNISVTSGTSFSIDTNGFNLTYSGALDGGQGGADDFKTGNGTLILTGTSNTFRSFFLDNGVLQCGAVNCLSSIALMTLVNRVGVTLDLNDFSQTVDSISAISGDLINIALGSGTLTVNKTSGTTSTYNGGITGTGGLTRSGLGTLILGGTTEYSGTTLVTGGILRAGAANSLSPNSVVSLNNTSGVILNLNSFSNTIGGLSGGGATGGSISLGTATLTVSQSSSTTYAGVISGSSSSTGVLTKTGTGTLSLTGTNTYGGGTNLQQGVLNINADAALGDSAANLNVTGSSTLQLAATIASTSRNIPITAGQTFTIDTNGFDLTQTGVISGSTGILAKTGLGTLYLQGTNTYGGGTTLNQGTLNVNADVGLGQSGTDLSVSGSSTLQFASAFEFSRNIAISSGQTLSVDTNGLDITQSGVISGSTGALTKTGSGTLLLRGANTYGGGTNLSQGILNINTDAVLGTSGTNINVIGSSTLRLAATVSDMARNMPITAGQTLTIDTNGFNLTQSGVLSGSTGAFTKVGAGTVILSGSNTYGGTTTVSVGALQAGAVNTFSSSSAVSLANTAGVTLDLNNLNNAIGSLSGGGTTGGNVTLGSGTLTLGGDNSSTTFAGTITGTGGVTKTGTGTFTISQGGGANTYSGTTTLSAGTLRAGAANAFSSNSVVSLANTSGAILDLNDFSNTIGGLSGGGTTGGNISLGTATLTVSQSSNTTYGGVISGVAGSLTKTGSGTLTLTGDSTFGATTVSAGQLTVNGTLTSPVTVGLNGTLAGGGIIEADVALSGTLSPGDGSLNTLGIIGDLTTPASTATTIYSISPTERSLVLIIGTASLDGSAQVSVAPGIYSEGAQYVLLQTSSSGLSGTYDSLSFSNPNFQGSLSYLEESVILTVTAFSGSITTSNLSGNSLVISNYINGLPSSLFSQASSYLAGLDGDEVAQAMLAISPSRNSFSTYMVQNNAFLLSRTVAMRMDQRRKKPFGKQESFVAQSSLPAPKVLMEGAFITQGNIEGAPLKPSLFEASQYNVWLTDFGSWSFQGAQKQNPSFSAFSGIAGLIGFDTSTPIENFYVGAMTGYFPSFIEDDSNFGKQQIDSALLGIYATRKKDHFFLEAYLGGVYNRTDSDRQMVFQGFNSIAQAEFNTWQFTPHVKCGYDLTHHATITPFISLDWPVSFQMGYTEQDATYYNMTVQPKVSSFLQMLLGLSASQTWDFSCGSLFLKEEAGYIYRNPFSTGTVNAAFVGAPGQFQVISFAKRQSLVDLSLECLFQRNDWFVSLAGDWQFGSGYKSGNLSGGLGIEF